MPKEKPLAGVMERRKAAIAEAARVRALAWLAKKRAQDTQAEQDRREREAVAASHDEWMRRMDAFMHRRPAPVANPVPDDPGWVPRPPKPTMHGYGTAIRRAWPRD